MPDEIYRFLTSEGAIKTILNRALRISDVARLNDPYDMLLGVKDFPDGYDRDVDLFEVALHLRKVASEHAGIISFSARPDDPTMWAHYAENHRGICLVFDPSVLPDEALKKVRYSKERPAISFSDLHSISEGELPHDLLFDALATKSESWSYEEEYRLILMITDREEYDGVFPLPKCFLKRVILGFDCDYTPSNIRSVLNAMGYDDIRIQLARLHPEKFEVDVCEYLRVDMSDIQPHEKERIEEKLREAEAAFLATQKDLQKKANAEQNSADQPATAPESKLEGIEKNKPKSEVRSQ